MKIIASKPTPAAKLAFPRPAMLRLLPAIIIALTTLQPLSARLPILGPYPWTGFFAGYSNKHYQFGLLATGEIRLTALDAKQEPVMPKLVIPVRLAIEETLPDGSTVVRKIDAESMATTPAQLFS